MKWVVAIIVLGLIALFWKSLEPEQVLFSNDGPFGSAVAEQSRPPTTALGVWQCNNWLGDQCPSHMGASFGLRVACYLLECAKWDEADWLGAIYGMLALAFPFVLVGAQAWVIRDGEPL